MATKKKIAKGMGVAVLLATGFAAAISSGLMAGQIPAALYGLTGDAKGCLTNLEETTELTPEMSLAQFHTDQNPLLIDGAAGAYCFNPPSKARHL